MKNDKKVAEIVEIAKKIPCEKSLAEQIDLVERYTQTHQTYLSASTLRREIECLKVIYPATFRHIEESDLVVGRTDVMPVGFGCVTSVGGVGHYCVFSKLAALRDQCDNPTDIERLNAVEDYWDKHDTRSIFYEAELTETTLGKFVDGKYPAAVTARMSGTMLNYEMLVKLGISGLRNKIESCRAHKPESTEFYDVMTEVLDLLEEVIRYHLVLTEEAKAGKSAERIAELNRVQEALRGILDHAPRTYMEGIELTWLYTLMAGVVNFGRMDVYLGELLASDLQEGRLTEVDALAITKSHYKLLEARRSNVNGRVIVGGINRPNPEAADIYCRFGIQAVRENRDIEPQFSLRCYKGMPKDIYELALTAIGEGCTYPMLYNDEAIIPEVMHALNVDEKTAENYVPFGCGELVIDHASVGTPNALYNMLKILGICLNGGIDPSDGIDRSNGLKLKSADQITSFEELFNQYKALFHAYIESGTAAHAHGYDTMRESCDFVVTSLLYDDCLENGASLLKGGVRYCGGTCETYGNINTSDSLVAIKKLVFDEGRYTLPEIVEACNADFKGYEELHRAVLDAPKYGNDDPYADDVAVALHDFICQDVREVGERWGFYSYNLVIINNQVNTEWGRTTAASPDGRRAGMFMNNGNNPQGGADVNGPTAMLNSLLKLSINNHAGSVQNIKFGKSMFRDRRPVLRGLFDSYWHRGGGQLMVSVVDPGELEDAMIHPELHGDLLVRVGGFSARFVNLEHDVQEEILSRTLNE